MRGLAAACLMVVLAAAPAAQKPDPRAAWAALDRRDGDAAAAAFRALLDAHPDDPRALTGAGLAAHLLGRDDQAMTYLRRAVQADPRSADAYEALGRLSYAAGDLAAAIDAYEHLVSLTPENRDAAARLEGWRKEAAIHDSLVTQPTGRFTILFEGETQQATANHISDVLEAAYYRVGKALNAFAPNPVTVILYTGEQFQDVTQSPSWAVGAYDERIRIPVRGALENQAELDRVVIHEFVHAVLHQVYPRVPKWLNEGLATLLEPGGHAWLTSRLRGDGGAIAIANLDAAFQTGSGDAAAVAYAQSYAGARLLSERLGASLPVLLQYLNDGMPLADALPLFNLALTDLEQAWTRGDYD